ncbi:DUF1752-domain-containing protein [Lichtheimia hyalospora FSU 10163]|nr:DUF1752-domain-containing protein [Lichtheimia hyalospora FSU 10163]
MIQSLDVPVVSLAVPNIHKLNEITSDDLSCMWTVFTKCKDNLENGRRLENLSWRLWYRESLIEKAKEQHVRTPIPIQHSNSADDYFTYASSTSTSSTCSMPPTPRSLKHVSPSSFKRMISSLNTPIEPYSLSNVTVSQSNHKSNTTPAATLVEHASSENDTIVPPSSATSQHPSLPNNHQQQQQQAKSTSKFYFSDEEDNDEDDPVQEDDDGFWSTVRSNDTSFILNDTSKSDVSTIPPTKEKQSTETKTTCSSTLHKNPFQKQVPPKIADHPPRQSLLTSLLVSKPTTPMVRPRRITYLRGNNKHQTCQPLTNDIDLSQSLRFCVDWEQQQNNTSTSGGGSSNGGLDSRVDNDHPSILASSYWDSFQGW